MEWKVTMRTSNKRAGKFGSTVGKILVALVFASMIGGVSIASAFDRYNDRRGGYYEYDQYEHGRRVRRSTRRYYREPRRYYRERAFVPPPVVHDPYPYQSPGIRLFLPIPIPIPRR
jgi:hypothetical protein